MLSLTKSVLTLLSAALSFDLTVGLINEGGIQDFLKPFLAACESKSSKLTVTALVSLQKQLANDAILHRDVIAVVHALEQVRQNLLTILSDVNPQLDGHQNEPEYIHWSRLRSCMRRVLS